MLEVNVSQQGQCQQSVQQGFEGSELTSEPPQQVGQSFEKARCQ